MFSGKRWATLVVLPAFLVCAQAAMAETTTIVIPAPEKATSEVATHHEAAPTRLFSVEKATTLQEGQNRFGASLQVGGLGTNIGGPSLVGGVNLRADMGLANGWESGISLSGLGGGNLLGNIALRAKVPWTNLMIGTTPVSLDVAGNLGALAIGGGIGSASVALGVPMTAVLARNVDLTVQPGLALGFSAGGLMPGGTAPTMMASGFSPAIGVGLEMGVTEQLSALIDGNIGFGTGLGTAGSLGVRYGLTPEIAADLFLGYQGSPLAGLNAGTLGVGGYYAF